MSYFKKVETQRTDLSYDAWDRMKVIHDYSVLSELFTYDVPSKVWKELEHDGTDYIEKSTIVNSTSKEGSLHLTTGTTVGVKTQLRTLRHARYQPNRGQIYSTSIFLPNPTANAIRRWGNILTCNGVYFELIGDGTNYVLNFVIRNHFVETKYDITTKLPAGIDLSKGNLFDFQMQWRGVGDFNVFVNTKSVLETIELGNRDIVSVENPSLPIGFEVENTGDAATIVCGCVDVTSEGGKDLNTVPTPFTTGNVLIDLDAAETAALAVRMPYKFNYNGDDVCYSRDSILNYVSAFVKDECVLSIYIGRGTNLTDLNTLTWSTKTNSFIEYIVGGSGTALNTAFGNDKANMENIHSTRQERDFANVLIDNVIKNEYFLTADDYIVIALDPDAAAKGGVTIKLGEQI